MPIPLPSLNRAIHFVFDWDGTLTKRDTLDALVNIAKEIKSDQDIAERWRYCTKAYLDDYEATLKELVPNGRLPTTVIEERKLLKSLAVVEEWSLARVSERGIFTGLTVEEVERGAAKAINLGQVRLRDGAVDFLRYITSRLDRQREDLDKVDIISVNWSQRFISSCLGAAHSPLPCWTPADPEEYLRQSQDRFWLSKDVSLQQLLPGIKVEEPHLISIYANEFPGFPERNACTNGEVGYKGHNRIISSFDKVSYLQNLRKISPYTMKPMPVVYVGDSWTDFECLLAADLGICIRDDPITSTQKKLQESFERLGIECPHINQVENADEWTVVWAQDFVEITRWFENSKLNVRS